MFKKIIILVCILWSQPAFSGVSGLEYIENKGQWNDRVLFKANMTNGAVFLENDGITFSFLEPKEENCQVHKHQANTLHQKRKGHSWKLEFVHSSSKKIIGVKKNTPYYNYFLGNEHSKWASHVNSFEEVTYYDLWRGIDLRVYSTTDKDGSRFKYDFIVHPNGNYEDIEWIYDGVECPEILNNSIHIYTSIGQYVENKPVTFLNDGTSISLKYSSKNSRFRFVSKLDLNNKDFTIDPELIGATYLGGTGVLGSCSSFDQSGNIIGGSVAGINAVFPATLGAFQEIMDEFSGANIGISKFSEDGNILIWSTYLGGSENEFPSSLVCNSQNEIYILGGTFSPDFPIIENALVELKEGLETIFISKLSSDGDDLEASTFLAETKINSLMLDGTSESFVSSSTRSGEIILNNVEQPVIATSTISENFPVSSNAYLTELPESYIDDPESGAVACLTEDLSELIYGTYLGGRIRNTLSGIRINSENQIIVIGTEQQSFIPQWNELYHTTANAYQTIGEGGLTDSECVLSVLSPDASQVLFCTYLSSAGNDSGFRIDLDSEDHIWIAGMSNSEIPLAGNAYSSNIGTLFIAKFSPDLSNLEISSQFGQGFDIDSMIVPSAFMVDKCNRIFVSANANYGQFHNLELTDNAFQTEGGFYLAQFSENMQELQFATLMGGNHTDGGHSRFEEKGLVYQAVCVTGNNDILDTTPNAWSNSHNGSGVELAVFKVDFQTDVTVSNFGFDIIGICAPVDVDFHNYSTQGNYEWFIDGEPAGSDSSPNFNFNIPGTHQVMLINEDLESCNLRDTSFLTIEIPEASEMSTTWDVTSSDPCSLDSLSIQAVFTGVGQEALEWNYENGTSEENSININYFENGTYPISLITYDEECAFYDTLETVIVYDPLHADWNVNFSEPCADSLVINAEFIGSGNETITWSLNSISENEAQFFFSSTLPGPYLLEATVYDEECDVTEQLSSSIDYNGFISVDAQISENLGCTPLSVDLNGQANFGTGYWVTPSGVTNQNLALETFDNPGDFEVMFIAQDSSACNLADSISFNIEVLPSLEASMLITPISQSECENELPVSFVFTGDYASDVTWNTGSGETFSGDSLLFTYSSPGSYEVSGTFINETCQQEVILSELLEISLFNAQNNIVLIPNVFSPNGDGFNDEFKLFNQEAFLESDFEYFSLKLYNRWGTEVFSSSSALDSWDGLHNQNNASEGVYFYSLSYKHKCSDRGQENFNGTVTLLR